MPDLDDIPPEVCPHCGRPIRVPPQEQEEEIPGKYMEGYSQSSTDLPPANYLDESTRCPVCGATLVEKVVFPQKFWTCPIGGGKYLEDTKYWVEQPHQPLPDPPNPSSILTLCLIVLFFPPLGVFGFVAYYLGRVYQKHVERGSKKPNATAKAGYVLASISVFLFFAFWIVVAIAVIVPNV